MYKILVALVMILSLGACGSGGGGSVNPPNGTIPPPVPGLMHPFAFRMEDLKKSGEISKDIYISIDRFNRTHPTNKLFVRVESQYGDTLVISLESSQQTQTEYGMKYYQNNGGFSVSNPKAEDIVKAGAESCDATAEANFIETAGQPKQWPIYGSCSFPFNRGTAQRQLPNLRWLICELNITLPPTGSADQQVILLVQQKM